MKVLSQGREADVLFVFRMRPGNLDRLVGGGRFRLGSEIRWMPRHAVFVRPAIDKHRTDEVTVRRRRWRVPFQRGGLPRIIGDLAAIFPTETEVDDERNLREAHQPGG